MLLRLASIMFNSYTSPHLTPPYPTTPYSDHQATLVAHKAADCHESADRARAFAFARVRQLHDSVAVSCGPLAVAPWMGQGLHPGMHDLLERHLGWAALAASREL